MRCPGGVLTAVLFITTVLDIGFGYPQNTEPLAAPEDDSDMYLEPQKAEESRVEGGGDRDNREVSQNTFYPSFSPFQNPPGGHSRPFYYNNNNQQEGAYSHRPNGFHQQQVGFDSPRYSGYKDDGYRSGSASNTETLGLLGSGNFGVIPGGTFYENEGSASESTGYDRDRDSDRDYNNYFRNGHGRPSFYGGYGGQPNPRPYQHEQFANFRDFADINTPANSAYSHYVVVYANRNGTKTEVSAKPKNIIESLALLDLEAPTTVLPEEVPVKKLSKSKAKLAKVPPEKKDFYKKKTTSKTSRELHEPLLALS